jgi:hypothetical protein
VGEAPPPALDSLSNIQNFYKKEIPKMTKLTLPHIDQHPAILSLDSKLRALTQRKVDLENRIRVAAKHRQENEDESAVDKLLADPSASLAKPEDPDQLRQELARVVEAIRQLDTQRQNNVSVVSREVCARLNPDYRRLVKRVLESARELTAANQAVTEFFDELNPERIWIQLSSNDEISREWEP